MKKQYRIAVRTIVLTMLLALTLAGGAQAAVDRKDLKPPETGYIQILTLTDGSNVNGQIVEVKGDEVVFESSVGTITLAIDKISEIREVKESNIRSGKYWFPNPNATRLYVGPTARMLKKGEGYFSDVYIFFPGVSYGLTDNISIGGGMSIFPGLSLDEQLFYFTPKIGLTAVDKLSIAASALITIVPEWSDDDENVPTTVGVAFGVATYGTEDKSLTFGLGYGFAGSELADKPAVIFGGEYRLGRRISFVSENWVLPEVEPVMISYGVRFFGEGLAVDLAFLNVASSDAIAPGIPYIDFVWNF